MLCEDNQHHRKSPACPNLVWLTFADQTNTSSYNSSMGHVRKVDLGALLICVNSSQQQGIIDVQLNWICRTRSNQISWKWKCKLCCATCQDCIWLQVELQWWCRRSTMLWRVIKKLPQPHRQRQKSWQWASMQNAAQIQLSDIRDSPKYCAVNVGSKTHRVPSGIFEHYNGWGDRKHRVPSGIFGHYKTIVGSFWTGDPCTSLLSHIWHYVM